MQNITGRENKIATLDEPYLFARLDRIVGTVLYIVNKDVFIQLISCYACAYRLCCVVTRYMFNVRGLYLPKCVCHAGIKAIGIHEKCGIYMLYVSYLPGFIYGHKVNAAIVHAY